MKRFSYILVVCILFIGCKTTTHNDFYTGIDYSKRSDAAITNFGLGFQGRPMFSERIGLVYQVGFLFPMAVDYQTNGLQLQRNDFSSGFGINGFIAPSFKVFDINDKISLFVSPGLNTGVTLLTKQEELRNSYIKDTITHQIGMSTLGIGVDVSTDFYLGKYFFMRLGVLLGLDFLSSDTIEFEGITDNTNKGVAQFRVYPKFGIGWRKTKEQKQANKILVNSPQVYEYKIKADKPYYKIILLWLADTINDSKSSIDFKDEELQIVKGTVNTGNISTLNLKWYDYTIRIIDNSITISFSNFRQGSERVPVFTAAEYKSFEKHTESMAQSLFNYLDTFQ